MPSKVACYILYSNGTVKEFKAPDRKKALKNAQEILGVRSLTRRIIDKLHVRSIHFGKNGNACIIFPDKCKRTLDQRKDHHTNHDRPACSGKHTLNIGRRQHFCRIAA